MAPKHEQGGTPAGTVAGKHGNGNGNGNGGNGRCRIVVTGGPGGGKTTAADLFRREIGDRVVVVPEAATLLFSGGFPRIAAPRAGDPRAGDPRAAMAAQRAIYHVQKNLEDAQSALFPERILLCDRGTVDGAAYWPEPSEKFFAAVGTTHEHELSRYDAVIFFESAAVGGLLIEGNPVRTESLDEAVALDARLREAWSRHPRFVVVPHNTSFVKKIMFGLAALESLVAQLHTQHKK
jgi:predicted ATPase